MWQVLQLMDIIHNVQLHSEQPDRHFWTRETSGQFTTKSAYEAFFIGGIAFEPYKRLWKAWAPLKVKIFLWLAIWKRYWTADRLQWRGLQHPPKCVLCDQEQEDMYHLLLGCIFAREVWFHTLQAVGLQQLALVGTETSFVDWWRRVSRTAGRERRKGLNTLIQLVAWKL